MLKGRNLVVDTFSEIYQQLKPWITYEFWNLAEHDVVPDSVYVIGRKQFVENSELIRGMIDDPRIQVIFDNAAEGSWTLTSNLSALGIDDLARQRRFLIIGGGDMEPEYCYMRVDHFLSHILDYEENLAAMSRTDEIFEKINKPYKFLFLNGRSRPHRKYLYEKFRLQGLLDQSIWTMLDSRPCLNRQLHLEKDGINLMATVSQLRTLPKEYEYEFYRDSTVTAGPLERSFVKNQLFNNQWGEIYLEPKPYIDTYFSLVTETIHDSPYSFRTEKIAKVLAMGHPWICATGPNFYRDIRNIGFKTFDHVIDESFDAMLDTQKRMDRIVAIVTDLCNQDLKGFLAACKDVCKYNQQRLIEYSNEHRKQIPNLFFDLVNNHARS